MTIYIPRTDIITGADCTGTSGTTNRTYTLDNANSISAGMVVLVGASSLQLNSQYTFASGVITFLVNISDSQPISIIYSTEESSPSYSPVGYTTTLECVKVAGIGKEVFNETLGTGDGSNRSYDLDNGNVIAQSYLLRYGDATGDEVNNLSELIETTDYTIDKNAGTILLTAAGVTKLGTSVLYANYVHSPKMSDDLISNLMTLAEDEVELKTGNYWGAVKSSTETFDGRETGRYPTTDNPYVDVDYDDQDELQLSNKSVQTITSIKFLNQSGGEDYTLSSSSYTFNTNGRIVFYSASLPVGKLNVEVVYTHGYATTPTYIMQLVSLITGIMIFSNVTGGSYDDATSYSLGPVSVSIGEVYVNVAEQVRQLQRRIDPLLNKIGSDLFIC